MVGKLAFFCKEAGGTDWEVSGCLMPTGRQSQLSPFFVRPHFLARSSCRIGQLKESSCLSFMSLHRGL